MGFFGCSQFGFFFFGAGGVLVVWCVCVGLFLWGGGGIQDLEAGQIANLGGE